MTVTRLARAAAIVAIFGLVSRLLGFAREIVLAASFGATGATDAFVNSLLIVNSIAAILLYTLVTLIIPVFQRERADRGTESAWRLVSALAVWTGLFLVVLSTIVAIWPEAFAALFQLDPSREAQTAELIRIMAPALALQGFSAIFTAMLQIHGRFAGPAAVGVAFNFGIIVGVIIGRGSIGIEAAGWGVVVGATLQVLLQLPQFWRLLREARARPALTHPGLGAVGLLALPVVGASILQQINSFTDKLFASSLEAGRVSALSFANALGQAPRVALLLPLLTPLFPLIARLISEGREREALGAFRRVAGLLALVSIPMMVFLAIYAQETAQLAFGRGKCGPGCVDQISAPLAFYALCLWPAFTGALLNRTLSAANKQRDILWTTIVTVVLTIGFDLILLGPDGAVGTRPGLDHRRLHQRRHDALLPAPALPVAVAHRAGAARRADADRGRRGGGDGPGAQHRSANGRSDLRRDDHPPVHQGRDQRRRLRARGPRPRPRRARGGPSRPAGPCGARQTRSLGWPECRPLS